MRGLSSTVLEEKRLEFLGLSISFCLDLGTLGIGWFDD
jgi:hypothetical protein